MEGPIGRHVQLSFVPWGNARSPGKAVTPPGRQLLLRPSDGSVDPQPEPQPQCQHGPLECELNRLLSCATALCPDQARKHPVVCCVGGGRRGMYPTVSCPSPITSIHTHHHFGGCARHAYPIPAHSVNTKLTPPTFDPPPLPQHDSLRFLVCLEDLVVHHQDEDDVAVVAARCAPRAGLRSDALLRCHRGARVSAWAQRACAVCRGAMPAFMPSNTHTHTHPGVMSITLE